MPKHMKHLHNDSTCTSVYTFIKGYIQTHTYAPSQREIAAGCFIAKSTVVRCLDKLEAKGFIVRDSNRARGIGIPSSHRL